MSEKKEIPDVSVRTAPHASDDERHATASATKSTRADMRDMARMGHPQQLIRHFSLWRSTAFVCVGLASWELTICTLNAGLEGGGRAGLLWSFVWNMFGFVPVCLSMAEMSSMAPIAGSQYHWVSEFGPERWQRGLSYFTGWMSNLAWQAGNATGILLTGQLIQAMIQVAYPDTYVPEAYQASLITIGLCVVTFCCNYYLHHLLPKIQNYIFAAHCIGFVIFVVAVAVNAPKATNQQVWLDFEGPGGWTPLALGVLAGQISGISAMTGSDVAGHIAEEIEDASYNVPRTMIACYVINAVFSVVITVLLCYAMPDLDAALADPTTYPAVYVLRQSMSDPCVLAFLAYMVFVLFCGNINYMVAVSRDLWAFARDKGTPIPKLLSAVSEKQHIPTGAIAASCIVTGALSLLYIGSATAYYAIISLFLVAILQCYMFTVGCVLWRRVFHPNTLPYSRFSLGRRGGIITNVTALIWIVWCFFWSFWPQSYPVSAENMNWAAALLGGTVLGAGLLFVFHARKVYFGPVHLVAGRKGNPELDLSSIDETGEDDERLQHVRPSEKTEEAG